jgi:hypothetical protein
MSRIHAKGNTKVTLNDGRIFEVSYQYQYESATHDYPDDFDSQIDSVYDEDGWDVTDNLTAEEWQEIDQLTADKISL